ncbi:hypothetical protein QEN19_000945 [Hanseniaspora menglaensis]
MVTFNCEVCNETVPKKQTEKHFFKCRDAYYTCIDCNKCFDDYDGLYKKHTQCITEDQKYMGKLYQEKGKKNNNSDNKNKKAEKEEKLEEKKESKKKEDNKVQEKSDNELIKDILTPGESLYKILKDLEKNKKSKIDKKQLLKKIIVDKEGNISIAK